MAVTWEIWHRTVDGEVLEFMEPLAWPDRETAEGEVMRILEDMDIGAIIRVDREGRSYIDPEGRLWRVGVERHEDEDP